MLKSILKIAVIAFLPGGFLLPLTRLIRRVRERQFAAKSDDPTWE